jgi:hypothetical protein
VRNAGNCCRNAPWRLIRESRKLGFGFFEARQVRVGVLPYLQNYFVGESGFDCFTLRRESTGESKLRERIVV